MLICYDTNLNRIEYSIQNKRLSSNEWHLRNPHCEIYYALNRFSITDTEGDIQYHNRNKLAPLTGWSGKFLLSKDTLGDREDT